MTAAKTAFRHDAYRIGNGYDLPQISYRFLQRCWNLADSLTFFEYVNSGKAAVQRAEGQRSFAGAQTLCGASRPAPLDAR